MNIRIVSVVLFVLTAGGCKAPAPPLTDDTLVSSTVDGVTLTHRHAITPPARFTPLNEPYRALYNASVMSRPDFGGKLVRYLDNGATFTALGMVENNWLAIAAADNPQLLGYVPLRAGVKSELWAKTVKADRRPLRSRGATAARQTCVAVDDERKACQSNPGGTWIID